jgi:parvulin-like peptidyl-prolyl isomerase
VLRAFRARICLATAAASAVVTLSACAPAHPGAAATVGNDRITVAQLQALTNRTLADPSFAATDGSDAAAVQREELTNLINHHLLDLAAQEKGVTVTEGEVGTTISGVLQQEGSQEALDKDAAAHGIAPADVHDYFYYATLESKLAPKIETPVVHVAHILVKDQPTAEKILEQVKANPSSFADIAKSQSTDTASAANGGDLGTAPSATFVTKFADAVDAAAVGSFFIVQTQFGWHVVHLISRTNESLQQITGGASSTDQTAQQTTGAIIARYLDGVASQAGGITVNPRYGVWDPDQGGVVASTGKLSSAAPSAPSAAPAS